PPPPPTLFPYTTLFRSGSDNNSFRPFTYRNPGAHQAVGWLDLPDNVVGLVRDPDCIRAICNACQTARDADGLLPLIRPWVQPPQRIIAVCRRNPHGIRSGGDSNRRCIAWNS